MKSIQKYCCLLSGLFLLAGCSTMNDQFSCPLKPGVQCQSLDQVNAKIDSGEIKSNSLSSEHKSFSSLESEPFTPKRFVETNNKKPSLHLSAGRMPVWIAPYEDEQGNYHEASVMWIVTNKAIEKNANDKPKFKMS